MNSGYEIVQAPRSLLIKNQYGPRPRQICLIEPDKIHKNIFYIREFEYEQIYCAKRSACVSVISFKTLRPRQNGRHFADDIFKWIFLNENVWIWIKISLKFVPKVPINNFPAFVQIMAWCRSGDKPLSESMMVSLLTHICVTRPRWVKTNTVMRSTSVIRYYSMQASTSLLDCIILLICLRIKVSKWCATIHLSSRPWLVIIKEIPLKKVLQFCFSA